jgi:hypothetical protein
MPSSLFHATPSERMHQEPQSAMPYAFVLNGFRTSKPSAQCVAIRQPSFTLVVNAGWDFLVHPGPQLAQNSEPENGPNAMATLGLT